uniref:Single-stranded-DNA-specific exonuclease RecJ n=1 Tax=uncultured Alphaproteobacteria bacterium TaxID=91750 RepID=A0A6G8F392_9PROT|nr:single-stranded-DNA-specific exonuclease RecJ [uncultured Alphaproteobacteria bacterium]
MEIDFSATKSLNGNIWRFLSPDDRMVELAAQKYNLPFLIAKILVGRHVEIDDIPDFIIPKLQNLMPDPYVLKDMEKAAQRIAEAVVAKQKIAVIGDYDVDGATSSSVLRLFLEKVGLDPMVHIPERDEGYGPSVKAVDEFVARGAELLITVDCGTTAFDVFDHAAAVGLPVIVLDHHEAEVRLPNVFALVNPKRLDESDNYPYLKYLAAVGVVFLTVVAVNRCLRKQGFYVGGNEPDLKQWLDLVALGTVCDVVPLLGLNRAFVRTGLAVMAQRQNIGLKALIDKSAINEAPTSYHLGYVLGPRINAGGRVGDSSLGNRLLCSKDAFQAAALAEELDGFNVQRKEIEAYVLLQAMETLEGTPQSYPMAFVYGHDWHQGVIGIVAGKLKERYNLPAFVMSVEADEVKGSARSIPGLDLGALIMAAKEKGILTKGGGHLMAAGFSLTEDRIEDFRVFAGEYIQRSLKDETLTPVLDVDGCIDVSAATPDFITRLESLEPYGAGNPEPKLMLSDALITRTDIVGSGHVRCFLGSLNGGSLKSMAFRCADGEMGKALLNGTGKTFNLVGVLRRDNWQGRNQAQFIIEDAMRA